MDATSMQEGTTLNLHLLSFPLHRHQWSTAEPTLLKSAQVRYADLTVHMHDTVYNTQSYIIKQHVRIKRLMKRGENAYTMCLLVYVYVPLCLLDSEIQQVLPQVVYC